MTQAMSLQQAPGHSDRYIYLIAAVAALGGLLFGFDTAVISGAIVFMEAQFEMTAGMVGWTTSCALLGCILGVAFAGSLSDRFGRKRTLVVSAMLFTVSALGTAFPETLSTFVAYRIVGGMGVGVASMLSPVYIAEISPARIRGRLVAMNQVAIITGMLVTYSVNYLIVAADIGSDSWRWMFAAEAVPSGLLLILLVFVPESPRFLAQLGKRDASIAVLTRVGGAQHAEREIREIEEALELEEGTVSEIFKPALRKPLMIGIVLAIATQVTGINTILYYMPTIFIMAGFEQQETAFLATIPVALLNVLFSLMAVLFVEKLGRRGILSIALSGMFVFLVLMGLAFWGSSFPPAMVVVIVLGYLGFFMFGLGPGFWVLVSEIYPTRVRGRALSLVTVVLWTATYTVSQTFPMLVESFSATAAFWIYAVMSLLALMFVRKVVPETKGMTLEGIESMWIKEGRSTCQKGG